MTFFGDIAASIRQALILAERVEQAARAADKAEQMAQRNRERIVRLETIVGLAAGRSDPLLPKE